MQKKLVARLTATKNTMGILVFIQKRDTGLVSGFYDLRSNPEKKLVLFYKKRKSCDIFILASVSVTKEARSYFNDDRLLPCDIRLRIYVR